MAKLGKGSPEKRGSERRRRKTPQREIEFDGKMEKTDLHIERIKEC
jgi:hypothetical protein